MKRLMLVSVLIAACGTIGPQLITQREDGGVILALEPAGLYAEKQKATNERKMIEICPRGFDVVEQGKSVSVVPKIAATGHVLIHFRCR